MPAVFIPTQRRNAAIALLFGFGTLAMVLLLMRVASDAPSAGTGDLNLPRPTISADAGCVNFGSYWTEASGLGIPVSALEQLSNCRLDAAGTWFVPADAADPRLADSTQLNESQRAAATDLQQVLIDQTQTMEASLSAETVSGLGTIFDSGINPVIGHLREGSVVGTIRKNYTGEVETYLAANATSELNSYVLWQRQRKTAGFDALLQVCTERDDLAYLHQGCRGVEDAFNVRFVPFPWEFLDPMLLEEYAAFVTTQER